MLLIVDTYDLICVVLGIVGTLLCVYSLYLCDWDFEKLMFADDVDTHQSRKGKK